MGLYETFIILCVKELVVMERTRKQNVLYYVVPTVLSSCTFFLFTIVDGIFVGRGINADALGAVNLAFPFIMLANAFNMLVTIGGVTITAIRLGRGDTEGANHSFIHSLSGVAVIAVLLCFVGVCFTGPLVRLLGAKDSYFNYAYDYLFWYAVFLIPAQLGMTIQGFCRNDGSPRLVAVANIVSTSANIFLDWLFIFPLQKGMAGAAVATGISQTISLCIMLTHFIRKKGFLCFHTFSPNFSLWQKIAFRGLPEMAAQFSTPVTIFCMNYALLANFGHSAVNGFSIINYVASFSATIFFGVSEGLQPLFGQSYGAKNEKNLQYYFRIGALINLFASVAIFILLLFAGGVICKIFGVDKDTASVILNAMPRFTWSFLLISLNTIISAYLFSTKRTKGAVIINVCRGLLFNASVISVFPVLFGAAAVWFTAGITFK
jgi:putative MATE family efflux protein